MLSLYLSGFDDISEVWSYLNDPLQCYDVDLECHPTTLSFLLVACCIY